MYMNEHMYSDTYRRDSIHKVLRTRGHIKTQSHMRKHSHVDENMKIHPWKHI